MRRHAIHEAARGAALAVLLAAAAALAACSGYGGGAHGLDDQLKFGVRMAQQGLWSEALFRFEKARSLDPANPRVLNNIAVALEAAGRYEEALEAYREALRLAPGNRDLERNYASFLDFYQSFAPPQEGAEAGEVVEPEGTP
ncbi:MAG TPA: tetratricopeptide repeat protein [Thermoanaerobaculia bacterium]